MPGTSTSAFRQPGTTGILYLPRSAVKRPTSRMNRRVSAKGQLAGEVANEGRVVHALPCTGTTQHLHPYNETEKQNQLNLGVGSRHPDANSPTLIAKRREPALSSLGFVVCKHPPDQPPFPFPSHSPLGSSRPARKPPPPCCGCSCSRAPVPCPWPWR